MAFGFDPSIILSGKSFDGDGVARTVADMSRLRMQQQQSDVTLADMLRKQQQEQTLADVLRQNADKPEAIGPALMRVGRGKEALDWMGQQAELQTKQDQGKSAQQDWLRKRGELMARPLQPGVPTSQQELDRLRTTWKSMGFSDGDMTGTETFDPVQTPQLLQQIRALGMSTEEGARTAETERHNREMEKRPPAFSGMTLLTGEGGNQYFVNPRNPKAPAVQVTDENGNPIAKPQGTKDTNAEFTAFTKAISTTQGRANLNAQNQARLYSSERVKQIALDDKGKIKDLSPAMLTDLAAATAALSSNGSPAQSVIEHFLPKGRGMSQAALEEWLTNDPHGANQIGFIKQMVDLANREEKLIHGQMQKGQLQAVPNFAHLKKADKAKFESILKAAGLDPAGIDENGLPVAAAPEGADKDAAAVAWAQANPQDPRALKILQLHGMAAK